MCLRLLKSRLPWKVFELYSCDFLFKISHISALDSISEHYFENEAMITWWNDWKARDQRAKIEKTYNHGRFSREKRTLGLSLLINRSMLSLFYSHYNNYPCLWALHFFFPHFVALSLSHFLSPDRHVYLESYTRNSISTTIFKYLKISNNELLINKVLEHLLLPSSLSFLQNIRIYVLLLVFEYSVRWPWFCLFLIYVLFPNNLVTNIVFPIKRGIYLESGIRPPFLLYKLGKFFLQVSWTVLNNVLSLWLICGC